jgi:hypothetical protein
MRANWLTPDDSAVASTVLAHTCESAATDYNEQLACRFFTVVPKALRFGRECARNLPHGWNEGWTSAAPDLDDVVMEALSVLLTSRAQKMPLLIAAWGDVHNPPSDEDDVLAEALRRLITRVIADETLAGAA